MSDGPRIHEPAAAAGSEDRVLGYRPRSRARKIRGILRATFPLAPLVLVLGVWVAAQFRSVEIEVDLRQLDHEFGLSVGSGYILFGTIAVIRFDSRGTTQFLDRGDRPAFESEIHSPPLGRDDIELPGWSTVEFAGFIFASAGYERNRYLDEEGAEVEHYAKRFAVIPMFAIALLAAIPALPMLIRILRQRRMAPGGGRTGATD